MVSEQGHHQDGSREEERDTTKTEQPSHRGSESNPLIHIVMNASYHSKPKQALCGIVVKVTKGERGTYGSNWNTTNCPSCLALELEHMKSKVALAEKKLSQLTSKNDPSMMGLG